jgi:uncharacterized protein (TIGR02246 family)
MMGDFVSFNVRDINRLRADAFETGDIWKTIDYFTDDTVWTPNGGVAIVGKDAVRAWATRFDGQTCKFRTTPEEVVVAGDWAFARFVGVMTLSSTTGEEERESTCFQCFWTLRRQEDGSWKIAHWIWNEQPPD